MPPEQPQAPDNAATMAPRTPAKACTLMQTPLRRFFEAAVRYEASDLLLRGAQVPRLRLRGALKALDVPAVEAEEFEAWVVESFSPPLREQFHSDGAIDLGLDLDEHHRFRVNIFRTRGRIAIAARRVNAVILDFAQLYLPPIMTQIADYQQGLVLVAGITGSGKSTTLASILQYINERRACHIVTIEDPIEYLFTDAKAVINQREVGIDVPTFAAGLRSLMRENPDVVLIGEMRDRETFEAALQAAETGHLVFGTIHASSASQAFGRIYELFPQEDREGIRNMLAFQMQAFVYQKLVPSLKPEVQRVPAVEVLLQSPSTRKYILESREHELTDVIKDQREAGMQTFTDSLVDLVQRQLIHPRAAQAAAPSPEEVRMRLKGISNE